jgi:hypothetical protein
MSLPRFPRALEFGLKLFLRYEALSGQLLKEAVHGARRVGEAAK